MRRPTIWSAATAFLGAAAVLCAATASYGELVQKYTFNNGVGGSIPDDLNPGDSLFNITLVDPLGIAQVAGGAADLSGNNGRLSNGDGAYLDLFNYTFSDWAFDSINGVQGAVSLEMWVTIDENRDNARLWDFGTNPSGEGNTNGFAWVESYVTGVAQSAFGGPAGATTHTAVPEMLGTDTFIAGASPLTPGVKHHVVYVLDQNDTNGDDNLQSFPNGTAWLYIDGALAGTGAIDTADGAGGIDITAFTEDNSWLGRSQFDGDPYLDAKYDEVRFYNHALSATEVSASNASGPDEVALPEITIDRQTGEVTVANNNSGALQLVGYSLTSAAGGLDTAGWQSIDAGWASSSLTANDISESGSTTLAAGADPAADLGTAWIPSSIEDIKAVVELQDGTLTGAFVNYVGDAYSAIDLNTDGQITVEDYLVFAAGNEVDLSGGTIVAAALAGDLDNDLDNDYDDFRLFKTQYDLANGAGAFAAALAGLGVVPEPGAGLLASVSALALLARRRRA